jgi:hypothetical protein
MHLVWSSEWWVMSRDSEEELWEWRIEQQGSCQRLGAIAPDLSHRVDTLDIMVFSSVAMVARRCVGWRQAQPRKRVACCTAMGACRVFPHTHDNPGSRTSSYRCVRWSRRSHCAASNAFLMLAIKGNVESSSWMVGSIGYVSYPILG